jgi:hypothetical protein
MAKGQRRIKPTTQTASDAMRQLEQIVDVDLAKGAPRSLEYRLGVLDAVRFRLNGVSIPARYAAGTAQADAYFAGNEHGHALWRSRVSEGEINGSEASTDKPCAAHSSSGTVEHNSNATANRKDLAGGLLR